MNENNLWIFPTRIKLEDVPAYMHLFGEEKQREEQVVFDLTKTTDVHSSFIGFLLHAKASMVSSGGTLRIIPSLPLQRILYLLRITDHFTPEIGDEPVKIN